MVNKKDYTSLFITEAKDHLTKLDNGLVELEKHPGSLELVKELNREAHTLKGAAGILGFHEIQAIAHRIEDIFDRVGQKRLEFTSLIAGSIFKGLDTIRVILEKIARNEIISLDISDVCKALEIAAGEETKREKIAKSIEETEVLKKPVKAQEPETKELGQEERQEDIAEKSQEAPETETPYEPSEIHARQAKIIEEYIALKDEIKSKADRIGELQEKLSEYMDREDVDQVFGDAGRILRTIRKTYKYDKKNCDQFWNPWTSGNQY